MSVFDDEIYTISDDSESEHTYVPKKGMFASLKDNKRMLLLVSTPIVCVAIISIIIVLRQSGISHITVHNGPITNANSGSKNHSSGNDTNNQQSQITGSNSPSATNPMQGLVNQVGSFLQSNHPIPSRKPNWQIFPAGTVIQAQSTGNFINQNTAQNSQNQSQSNQSSSTQQAQPTPLPTPINNDIHLVFKDPDGTVEVYQPPPSPPADIVWGRYVNTTDRYAIDYPTNWQMVKTFYNGHEGISLYLPGVSIDQYAGFIGFGWAIYYLLPAGVNINTAYTSPISVSSVNGTLYTQGALGYSYIASVFQYQNGYWGLGTTISDPTFAYVYDHMINSLVFNQ